MAQNNAMIANGKEENGVQSDKLEQDPICHPSTDRYVCGSMQTRE